MAQSRFSGTWLPSISRPPSRDVRFGANVAPEGGAIACVEPGAEIELLDCTFDANESYLNGAGLHVNNRVSVFAEGCRFTGARDCYRGGGIYAGLQSAVQLVDCVFEDNEATYAGAVYGYVSTLDILSCRFVGNSAVVRGGAVHSQIPG